MRVYNGPLIKSLSRDNFLLFFNLSMYLAAPSYGAFWRKFSIFQLTFKENGMNPKHQEGNTAKNADGLFRNPSR